MMKPEKEVQIIKYCIVNYWGKKKRWNIPAPNSTTSKWQSLYEYIQLNHGLFGYIQELLPGVLSLLHFQIKWQQQLLLCITMN